MALYTGKMFPADTRTRSSSRVTARGTAANTLPTWSRSSSTRRATCREVGALLTGLVENNGYLGRPADVMGDEATDRCWCPTTTTARSTASPTASADADRRGGSAALAAPRGSRPVLAACAAKAVPAAPGPRTALRNLPGLPRRKRPVADAAHAVAGRPARLRRDDAAVPAARRPARRAVMIEQARGMSNDDLRAFADAISKLPPPLPPTDKADPLRFERGRALAAQHRCGVCHNPDFSGREQMPRLANQREDYLLKAMREFASGKRLGYGAAMTQELSGLSGADLADLAHFFAHQPASAKAATARARPMTAFLGHRHRHQLVDSSRWAFRVHATGTQRGRERDDDARPRRPGAGAIRPRKIKGLSACPAPTALPDLPAPCTTSTTPLGGRSGRPGALGGERTALPRRSSTTRAFRRAARCRCSMLP